MPELLLILTTQKVLIAIPAFVGMLGVLVFVHEFGHFFVARLCGVRVEVFSLGFGKRLWGFRRGDTDYRVSLLPIGGYVKMAGENPMEERTGDPGEFMSHPRWQRFLVAIAGPSLNVLLALGIWTVIFMTHFETPAFLNKPADVGGVRSGSAAEKASLKPGDRIIRIASIHNPTFDQVENKAMINAGQNLELTVQRGGQTFNTILTPHAMGPHQSGDAGITPMDPVLVARVDPGPAATAGIKVGDQIIRVNKTTVNNFEDLVDTLQQTRNTPVAVTVLRSNSELPLTVTPVFGDVGAEKKWKIGIVRNQLRQVTQLPLGAAVVQSVAEGRKWSSLIFELVGNLLQRKVSIKTMSGPIGIAQMSEEAAEEGPTTFFFWMALVSLQLAIFNMFPIPILDGGLMVMLLIEGVMRRDIKQEIKERVYQLAFVFLLVFAAVVIFNDVAKNF